MICLVTLVVWVMRGRRMLRSCIFWLSGLLLLFLGAPWIVTWLHLGLIDGGVRQFWSRSWVRKSLIAWLNSWKFRLRLENRGFMLIRPIIKLICCRFLWNLWHLVKVKWLAIAIKLLSMRSLECAMIYIVRFWRWRIPPDTWWWRSSWRSTSRSLRKLLRWLWSSIWPISCLDGGADCECGESCCKLHDYFAGNFYWLCWLKFK